MQELLHYERVQSPSDSAHDSNQHENRTANSTLVLVHGLFGSTGNVMTLARMFLPNFVVYAVDLPNHGKSPWIDNARYNTAARYLHRTIERIAQESAENLGAAASADSLPRVDVYGHSMGGKVVMALALLQEEFFANSRRFYALRSISIGDIAPQKYPPGHERYFNAMKNMPRLQSRREADKYMAGHVANPVLRSFLLKNLARGDDGCLYWRLNIDILVQDYSYILDWDIASGTNSHVPALFLRGAQSDYILPSRDRNCIWGHFPHARIEEIDNAAHWIHSENPRAVHSRIEEFILNL